MKNQIIPLEEKNRKVFGFSDDKIILSSKRHDTFESLEKSSIKSGLMETVKSIPMADVKGLEYNEKESGFTIKYDKKGKIKSEDVSIEVVGHRDFILTEMASIKGFEKNIEEESKTSPLLLNLLGVVLISVFTYVGRGMAVDAQHGEHYVATGRRSGIAQLLVNAIEGIGPLGVTLIGVAALAYMIYRTYDRYSNPAKEIKFS